MGKLRKGKIEEEGGKSEIEKGGEGETKKERKGKGGKG